MMRPSLCLEDVREQNLARPLGRKVEGEDVRREEPAHEPALVFGLLQLMKLDVTKNGGGNTE